MCFLTNGYIETPSSMYIVQLLYSVHYLLEQDLLAMEDAGREGVDEGHLEVRFP